MRRVVIALLAACSSGSGSAAPGARAPGDDAAAPVSAVAPADAAVATAEAHDASPPVAPVAAPPDAAPHDAAPHDAPADAPPDARAARRVDGDGDWRGLTEAELLASEGEPIQREGASWIYWQPRGCADKRRVVTVRFRRGRVVAVDRKWVQTGEHCAYGD